MLDNDYSLLIVLSSIIICLFIVIDFRCLILWIKYKHLQISKPRKKPFKSPVFIEEHSGKVFDPSGCRKIKKSYEIYVKFKNPFSERILTPIEIRDKAREAIMYGERRYHSQINHIRDMFGKLGGDLVWFVINNVEEYETLIEGIEYDKSKALKFKKLVDTIAEEMHNEDYQYQLDRWKHKLISGTSLVTRRKI